MGTTYFDFVQDMIGFMAIDSNGNQVYNYELFWYHKCKSRAGVFLRKFKLINREKHGN